MKNNIKILFHCSKCKEKIITFRDKDNDLDGNFIGIESKFSEMLNKFVSTKIICIKCLLKI